MFRSSIQNPKARLSTSKKLLFAAVVIVGFFVVTEGVLMLVGFGSAAADSDPLVGFSRQRPLFVPDLSEPDRGYVVTADNKRVWFNHQRFQASKPPGVQRVFCLGGSTTFGRPYDDTTSFSGWLREFLPLARTINRTGK